MRLSPIQRAIIDAIAYTIRKRDRVGRVCLRLSRVDPLSRRRARRRFLTAYAHALRVHPRTDDELTSEWHLLRMSGLLVADVEEALEWPREEVEARFDAITPEPRRRYIWWPTIILTLIVLCGLTFAGRATFDHLTRPAQPEPRVYGASDFTAVAPSPLGVVEVTLAETLTELTIAANAQETKKVLQHRAALLDPNLIQTLGPDATQALDALVSLITSSSRDVVLAYSVSLALIEATRDLNAALEQRSIPVVVDTQMIKAGKKSQVLLAAYRIEKTQTVSLDDTPLRLHDVQRIDRMDWIAPLLAFTREGLTRPLVDLQAVDQLLSQHLLPALRPGASLSMVDEAFRAENTPWIADAEALAGELIRGALDPEGQRHALAALMSQRQAVFEQLATRARDKRLVVSLPRSYRLTKAYIESLRPLIQPAELQQLAKIDVALNADEHRRSYQSVRALFTRGIHLHEAHHQLEFNRAYFRDAPARLAQITGPTTRYLQPESKALSTRDELSAYLAELAYEMPTSRLSLIRQARFLLSAEFHGSPEALAAGIIFEDLARRLQLQGAAPILSPSGLIDRDAAGLIFLQLGRVPQETLRAAAAELWTELFEAPLPRLGDAAARP